MVRTRFAPSPTGHLHVGGARTALFSYYFAKKNHGEFILRIEDTDIARSKKEYEDEILRSLNWLGVHWDGKVYKQSERQELYRQYANKLLESGKAYKCFLTSAELDAIRGEATAKGLHPKIRSPWRDKKPGAPEEGKPFVIRFRYPDSGQTILNDGILGQIVFENSEGDDLIILRSDGTPTYQLSVVVDDLDMQITHVIRGDDHVSNTPKQILMIEALGGKVPVYAHCPMILGPDKAKLSKRHGAVSVYEYSADYLPEALRNALIRLGWSHGDQEIFTNDELVKLFSLEECGKSAAVFDVQKLDWINGEFIKKKTPEEFVEFIKNSIGLDLSSMLNSEGAKSLLDTVKNSTHKAKDVPERLSWYLGDVAIDPVCKTKILDVTPKEWIAEVMNQINNRSDTHSTKSDVSELWTTFDLDIMEIFKSVAAKYSVKMPQIAKPVRVLLTGNLHSPDMSIVCAALGKQKVLARLKNWQ